jgi:ATP dependent DNA ligase-like protein
MKTRRKRRLAIRLRGQRPAKPNTIEDVTDEQKILIRRDTTRILPICLPTRICKKTQTKLTEIPKSQDGTKISGASNSPLRQSAFAMYASYASRTSSSVRQTILGSPSCTHSVFAPRGIIAKRNDLSYQTGKRTGMQKQTAHCRLRRGWRPLSREEEVGRQLLGLYNEKGLLDHVGFTSSIHNEDRRGLTKRLEAMIKPPGFTGKAPGGLSRWSTKHSMEWQPLDPKLVAEVQFDHFTGGRFRHGTKFLRWRPDKDPRLYTRKQVQRENRSALDLF